MSDIDATLAERGTRYGEFTHHSAITQAIKDAMKIGRNWEDLDDDMKEALEMVAHKAGRILNGDPQYIDSWTDIIGYARLVEKRLITEQASVKSFMDSREETVTAEKCDDVNCPGCYPENRVSIGDMLAAALSAAVPKAEVPTGSAVSAALKTLLEAGVITHT